MINEAAKKYISELHKRQDDPSCWPDYLTGLPGKQSILQQIDRIYPRIGRYGVAYLRIANVYPYLIKYGYDRHVDIIEWAAAILKSAADTVQDAFVGAVSTHDFALVAKAKDLGGIIAAASEGFRKKAAGFYSPSDRKKGIVLSYKLEGRDVCVGLMEFIHSSIKKDPPPQAELISHLASRCSELEKKWLC
jgi:GGDEF domain-containing protein